MATEINKPCSAGDQLPFGQAIPRFGGSIDRFMSDDPSRDNGRSGHLAGKNSTQGGD